MLREEEVKKWISDAIREYFSETQLPEETPININEPLLSRQEAAAFLRISIATLSGWVGSGLPHYKWRGKIYFTKSEMLRFLQSELPTKAKFSDKSSKHFLS